MARRGALALASWATATVVASIASVAGISMVTTQVTRPPLPTGSSSAAPTAHGAVPVRVSPVAAESEEPTSHRGPVHATFGSPRSAEHTSELQSLMRISYALFCLKTNKHTHHHTI